MAYDTRFTISKGVANEFVFTIKQSLAMTPMVISEIGATLPEFTASYQPSYDIIAPVEYVAPVAATELVPAVIGQAYISDVTGLTEDYTLTIKTLEVASDPAVPNELLYSVIINGVIFTLNNVEYTGAYSVFKAFETLITANTTLPCTATVDENTLILTGKVIGTSYTVNSTDNIYVNESQTARNASSGQDYIKSEDEIPATSGTLEVIAVPITYTSTQEPVLVSFKSNVPDNFDSNIQSNVTMTSGSIASLTSNGSLVTPVGGVYGIGTNQEFTVVPVDEGTGELSIPAGIALKVETTLTGSSIDSFSVQLIKKDNDELVATIGMIDSVDGIVTVDDAVNGKIKVVLKESLTTGLIKERGERADSYYSKPTYRLLIEADTLNNGKFPIVIDKVYVR